MSIYHLDVLKRFSFRIQSLFACYLIDQKLPHNNKLHLFNKLSLVVDHVGGFSLMTVLKGNICVLMMRKVFLVEF